MKNNYNAIKQKHIIVLLFILLGGLILLIISSYIPNANWANFVSSISSILLISGGFGIIDQFYLKKELVDMILEKIKLKEEIDKTGIEEVFTDINDIDYKYYIRSANKNLDIVHIYGRSWTTRNIDLLKDKVLKSNCNIRVFLLSPESGIVTGLEEYFDLDNGRLVECIEEVKEIWEGLAILKHEQKRKPTNSSLKVYYHKGNPAYSLYRVDDRIILVSNKLIKGRTTYLPSFVFKSTNKADDLYDTYLKQIDSLALESEEIISTDI